jgi:hypothetical protein
VFRELFLCFATTPIQFGSFGWIGNLDELAFDEQ